ncbi:MULTISPECIES: hypothetical protein [Halorussus]|uniref:hypothetical protein n=1 Tax=Halorussus TaxID=1070314 RepID=UPI00209F9593|nr:hypothetical protein [Halorussus vallis]USZ77038.1 hypothetical protein NGM07_06850 [Halorussus vallis]
MARNVALEAEEWYVLCNWLRERENRLMYALRPRSAEWEFIHGTRRRIEDSLADAEKTGAEGTDAAEETGGELRTVALSDAQFAGLVSYLRRRSLVLRFLPWRYRERRDVVHLRRHLLDAAVRVSADGARSGARTDSA